MQTNPWFSRVAATDFVAPGFNRGDGMPDRKPSAVAYRKKRHDRFGRNTEMLKKEEMRIER